MTSEFRVLLKNYIKLNNIKSVIDLGCGIWEFDHNEFDDSTYIGIDCVKRVIDFNKERYGSKKRVFIYADILDQKNNIPNVDLCIIKDLLQHLNNKNIDMLINKVLNRSKYIILVQDHAQETDNQDILNGGYRPLSYNLQPLKKYNPLLIGKYWTKHILLIGNHKNSFITDINSKIEMTVNKKSTSNDGPRGPEFTKETNENTNNENTNNEEKKVDNGNINVEENNENIDNQNEEKRVDIGNINVEENNENRINNGKVLLSILARNKGHVLKKYLEHIEDLDYDKKLITIYINTNNNSDDTEKILEEWIKMNENNYAKIEYEKYNIDELENISTNPHTWNTLRFKKLGAIRNKSLKKTIEYDCDYYFVVDCDNFIESYTLKDLIEEDKPMISPMLRPIPEENDSYSNFFCDITPNGYYKNHKDYMSILHKEMVGVFKLPVVHCTYLIKREYIEKLNYIDDTPHHEFIVLSRYARKNGVDQYLTNKKEYGKLVHFFDENIKLEDEIERLKKYDLIMKNKKILDNK
jgi:hypothetical protein